MKPKEYLKAIEKCPDSELTDEFGIYDDFRILLKADFEKVVYDLKNSGRYFLKDIHSDERGNKKAHFNYVPGALNVHIWNSVHPVPGERTLSRIKWDDYEVTAIIHSDLTEKIKGLNPRRAIVLAVTDLSEYIQGKRILACLPDSKGWKHLKDDSRIVYFKP